MQTDDVANGKPVTVSSHKFDNKGKFAVDGPVNVGDVNTFWASDDEAQPWLMVDLEVRRFVGTVRWATLVTKKKDVHWVKMKKLMIKIG